MPKGHTKTRKKSAHKARTHRKKSASASKGRKKSTTSRSRSSAR